MHRFLRGSKLNLTVNNYCRNHCKEIENKCIEIVL